MTGNNHIKVIASVIIIVVTLSVVGVASGKDLQAQINSIHQSNPHTHQKRSKLTSLHGAIIKVSFNRSTLGLSVHVENPTKSDIDTYLTIIVDSYRVDQIHIRLAKDRAKNYTWELTPDIDILQKQHSLLVSTIGSHTEINFTKKVNTTRPGPIPTPKITNVKIANGTIDGEPSAVAKVTVENPSIQTYPTKLMVHTQGTDGSFYGASVPPGGNRTITVELLDDRGSKIAGEARLYANNLSNRDGAMDQVGFVGRASDDTSVWNESYEPVNPPWMKNSYHYRNESLSTPGLATRLSDGWTFGGVPGIYAVLVGLVLVLLGLKIRR